MIVEICNYCNLLLGVVMVNKKPCCQFCAEEQESLKQQEQLPTNPAETRIFNYLK
jgi:hypothetical protein